MTGGCLTDGLDPRSAIFFAEDDGEVVATARVTNGDHIAVGSPN